MPDVHVVSKCVLASAFAVFLAAGAYAYTPVSPAPSTHGGTTTAKTGWIGSHRASDLPLSTISVASRLILCASCGTDHEGQTAQPQSRCPVMNLPINKELHVDVRGQRLYVCCQGCVGPVRENGEAALEILHERHEYAESLQTMCPVMNAPINKDMFVEYKGRRIYVCCPPCIQTIQTDPARYAAIIAGDDPDAADAAKDGGLAASSKTETSTRTNDPSSAAGNAAASSTPNPIRTENPSADINSPATTSPDEVGAADGSGLGTAPAGPQTRCPIMDAPVTPGTSAHVDVKGYRIYICCPPCRADIEADPDAALAAIRARGEEPEPLPLGAGN